MDQLFKMLSTIQVIFFIALRYTEAAATTTGESLKFYPINPQEYVGLSTLINQQPVISEQGIFDAGHRSLADWSQSMPNGWNDIFDIGRKFPETLQNDFSGYPLCVLKTNNTMRRRKRSGKMYNFNHAGVAPNVGYVAHSYPQYVYQQPSFKSPVYGPPYYDPVHYNSNPHDPPPYGTNAVLPTGNQNENASALVNCVVVLRRNNNPSVAVTSHTPTHKPDIFPPRPAYLHPYPHPLASFKLPPPPSLGYPSYDIPSSADFLPRPSITPYALIPESVSRNGDATSSATAYPQMDPASNAVFHQMLTEYYQQLGKLYVTHTLTEAARSLEESGVGQVSVPSVKFSLDDNVEIDSNDDDVGDNENDNNNNDNGNDSDVDVDEDDDEEYNDYSQDDANTNFDEDVDVDKSRYI